MLIDWFTVGAQALNFLLLVWLLKRFLYQPILKAIDAREKRVADELAEADARKAEATKEREEFLKRNQELDRDRTALLRRASDEAKAERQRLLEEARKAADALSAKRQEALRHDANNLSEALTRRTQQEVFAIARKTLADLAGISLEDRAVAVFIQRLRALDPPTRNRFGQALLHGTGPGLVCSAFDLPQPQQAALQSACNEIFAGQVQLRFETTPDLVGGIELAVDGQKLAWSIDEYLTSMEHAVTELLRPPAKPGATPAKPAKATTPAPSRTDPVKPTAPAIAPLP